MFNKFYWDKYKMALETLILAKGVEVCQIIQEDCHNCAELKVAQDDLLKITIMISHEDDKEK